MINADFHKKVTNIMNKMCEILENHDQEGQLDIDLNNNILTINAPWGKYVLNQQSAVQELWLSSPISGPHHFVLINEQWQSTKGLNLLSILSNELKVSFDNAE